MKVLKRFGSIKAVILITTKHGMEVSIGMILHGGEVIYKTEGLCTELINTRVLKHFQETINI